MYIVLVNWKLAKNTTMDPVLLLFGITTKNHHLYSCARIGMSTRGKKKEYSSTGIYNEFLCRKTDLNQNAHNYHSKSQKID